MSSDIKGAPSVLFREQFAFLLLLQLEFDKIYNDQNCKETILHIKLNLDTCQNRLESCSYNRQNRMT